MVVPLLRGLSGLSNNSAAERRRASSLTNALRSAKDNAMRIAEDKSARGSQVLTTWKAKAQEMAAAAAAARSSRKSVALKEEGAQTVRDLCNMGFTPAAARLALRRSGTDITVACHWLLEDENQGEILAAEAKDPQTQEALAPAALGGRPAAAFPSPEEYLELEGREDLEKADTGAGLGMGSPQSSGAIAKASPRCGSALDACSSTDVEPCEGSVWSSPRPPSSFVGNACASGFASCISTARSSATGKPPAAPRTPKASPRQGKDEAAESPVASSRECATEPARRTNRGDLTSDEESQPTGPLALSLPLPAAAEPARRALHSDLASEEDSQPVSSASDPEEEEEADGNGDSASEFSSSVQRTDDASLAGASKPVDESEFEVPLPPSGASWEWPLSRNEKKERLWMLEKNLQTMDKKILLRELVQLRVTQRQSALGSPIACKHQ